MDNHNNHSYHTRHYEFVGKQAYWPRSVRAQYSGEQSTRPALTNGSGNGRTASITIVMPDTPQLRNRNPMELLQLIFRAHQQQQSSSTQPSPTPMELSQPSSQPTLHQLSASSSPQPSTQPTNNTQLQLYRQPRGIQLPQLQQTTQTSPSTTTPTQPPSSAPTIYIIVHGAEGQDVDMNAIMNQLFQSQQPQTNPAAQQIIDSLPQIKITQEILVKQPQCPVCMEDFHVDEDSSQLPCKHCFHKDCISRWLRTQHTCPVCRHELPVEETPAASTEPVSHIAPTSMPLTLPAPEAATLPPTSALQHSIPAESSLPSISTMPTTTTTSIATSDDPTTPSSSSSSSSSSSPSSSSPSPSSSPQSSPRPRPPQQGPTKPEKPHESGVKRGFLLPKGESPVNKKKKVEEEKPKEQKREENGFGFKRGFLNGSAKQ